MPLHHARQGARAADRGLILIALLLALLGDPFGVKAGNRKVSAVLDKAAADQAAAARDAAAGEGSRAPPAMPGGGARVRLAAAGRGDDGWASRIDGALDGRIGAPDAGAMSISGGITARDEGFSVAWSIAMGGESARCGTTTVSGAAGAPLIDQLAASFRTAVERSIEAGRAVCY